MATQAWFKSSRVKDGSRVCVASAMQSISLRSTEGVICLVQCEPFRMEFAKFFKTAKVRQVGLAGGLMRITWNRSKTIMPGYFATIVKERHSPPNMPAG